MINISFWNIAFTVINLLILFVAFRIFFFKPLRNIIQKRQEEADELFKEATEKENQATQMKAELEEEKHQTELEKKTIISDARKSADVEAQHIIADAKEEARNIHDAAVTSAHNQKSEIIDSAKKEIAQMVVEATSKVVGTQASAEIDSELYDKFIGKAGDES